MDNIQSEVMLAGWSESHTGGCKVTFWLPDSESLEPFKGLTVIKGKVAGQLFMMVLAPVEE